MKRNTIKKLSIAIATALLVCAAPVSVFAAEDSPLECENDIHYECDSLFVLEEQSDVNSDEFGSVSSDFNADFQLDNAGYWPRGIDDKETFRPAETDPRYKGSLAEKYHWLYWATDWADLGPNCSDDSLILEYALYSGFMNGMSKTYFGKNEYLTRAQMVQVLYNMKKCFDESVNDTYNPKFKDVPEDAWYAKAVYWAANDGVTAGISATEFGPDQIVTAQEVCVFAYRFFNLQRDPVIIEAKTRMKDFGPTQADAWAAESVYACSWLVNGFKEDEYVLNEVGCHHDIKGPASRRDVAVMACHMGHSRGRTDLW